MKKYKTQSLYEASFLLAKGFKLLSKDLSGQKTHLIFEDTPELDKTVMNFYNGDGEVKAKAFVDSYRSLKDYIFER